MELFAHGHLDGHKSIFLCPKTKSLSKMVHKEKHWCHDYNHQRSFLHPGHITVLEWTSDLHFSTWESSVLYDIRSQTKTWKNSLYCLSFGYLHSLTDGVYRVLLLQSFSHGKAARNCNENTIRSRARPASNLSLEEIRMTKLLLVLVVAFIICWVPVITVDFLNAIMGTGSLPREAYVTYTLFAFGSSCINPIVCLTLNSKIRREAKKLILFKRLRQVEDPEAIKETKRELTIIFAKENEGRGLRTTAGGDYDISAILRTEKLQDISHI